ncbi:hypothetical protein [Parasulfitobacter algicola]|uniref:Uncharacterized protein n=1 Tax=Parasulfitobacter algicola TaxID=2614809 RepID=A0ABX2IUT7_9RHOB|nr:hypothetical protein [Sulfitobacter algicola]NSX56310.1 hypothetical protein [Sulfitobacter algicola]
MSDAEEIFAKIPEPEFWAAPLLQEIRTGWQQETGAFNPDPSLQDTGVNAGIVPMSEDPAIELSIRQEIAAEQAFDPKDAIEQIEWLLSIIHGSEGMHTFSEMLTKPVRRKPEDFGEYAQWVTQDYIEDQMSWEFAAAQGRGSGSKDEGRTFLKHWLRFIYHHFGQRPFRIGGKDRGSLMRTGEGEPSDDQVLEGMNPAMRLGFWTAKTKYPGLSHRDVTQVIKDNSKNTPFWIDPNGGKLFSPE